MPKMEMEWICVSKKKKQATTEYWQIGRFFFIREIKWKFRELEKKAESIL